MLKGIAESKGEYQSRYDEISKLYEGIEGVNIEEELTADLVGDYLFTDSDFISRLSAEKPGVFKKFFDEIKYLCRVATAGSKEAKELEKVKKTFEELYRESKAEKNTAEGGVRYSLDSVDGIDFVKAERNIFIKKDGTMASEREIFNALVGKTIPLSDGEIKIVKRLPEKDMFNELSRRYPKYFDNVDDIKQLNSSVNHNMEELITNSKLKIANEPDVNGKHQKQGIASFDTRNVKFYDGDKAYDIEFSIAILQNGEKIAYAKKFYGYDAELTKKIQTAEGRSKQSPFNQQSVSIDIISDSTKNVKQKQLEIIEKVNPAPNTYNTWIRKVEDIKTLAETLEDSDWADGDEFNPDLTRDMIEEAIESGEITVYSSYPIEQGVFVSPSYMEAASYSGDGNVYEKTVKTDEVAWIDPTQGMYANTAESYSLSSKDTAPKKYGDYAVYGEDVMLEGEVKPTGKREFTAPMRADVNKNFPMLDEDDVLPIRKELKNDLLSRSAKSFGITKPGDYVQVQRQVFDTLEKEGFFSDEGSRSRTVTNSDSSMRVEINKKGIKETFNFDNYGKQGIRKRAMKLATVRMLPQIIENGKLIGDNVENYHNDESSNKFAYIKSEVQIDGQDVVVKIDIKKSPQKNKFWVHSIDIKEKVDGLPADTSRVLKRANEHIDYEDSISNTDENVNSKKDDGAEQILGESQLRTAEPKKNNIHDAWKGFLRSFVSKGAEVETYALKGKNRAVEDKYRMWKDRSEAKAQYFMEKGDGTGKSLKDIYDTVTQSGLEKEFDLYMKHRLNVDRMKYKKYPLINSPSRFIIVKRKRV